MVNTSASENAQPSASNRLTALPRPVTDEDDEPPSGGPHQGLSQMNRSSPDGRHSTSSFPPVKSQDTLDFTEKATDIEQGGTNGLHNPYGHGVPAFGEELSRQRTRKAGALDVPVSQMPWHRNLFKISKKSKIRTLFTNPNDIGPRPTSLESLKTSITYSYLNLLLLFIPVSWGLHYSDQNSTLVFVFSCLAIVPLAALLGLGTEQIALTTSQSVGGLLNATLGNVVELIIGAVALSKCELDLVQSSLLGGQLSNLLLVLGTAFLVGGTRFQQSEFQPMVAQLNSSLLIVSVIAFFIPVAFHVYIEDRLPQGAELPFLLRVSHGSAVVQLTIYFAYLFFQFYSHNYLFVDMEVQTTHSMKTDIAVNPPSIRRAGSTNSRLSPNGNMDPIFGSRVSLASAMANRPSSPDTDEDAEHLRLNLPCAFILLGVVTVLVYFTAENLVSSLEGLLENHPNVSKKWISLIVIPIVGNAAEYATAVLVARKGKFNLSMSVAVGSCIQIAFFVIPLLVIVAWGLGKPLTLLFDPLETFVKFSVEDGKSHWLNGLAFISVYVLYAVAFWGYPETVTLVQKQPITCV
ncbi:calcium ion transporter [Coprinopsis sp. MPI-PUGE-AT-0042]|nr:calcium ion transporter [Coprinopsis sp. MPI-PUGE-AT-0042]